MAAPIHQPRNIAITGRQWVFARSRWAAAILISSLTAFSCLVRPHPIEAQTEFPLDVSESPPFVIVDHQGEEQIDNPFVTQQLASTVEPPPAVGPSSKVEFESTPRFRVTVRPADQFAEVIPDGGAGSDTACPIEGDVEYESSPLSRTELNRMAANPPKPQVEGGGLISEKVNSADAFGLLPRLGPAEGQLPPPNYNGPQSPETNRLRQTPLNTTTRQRQELRLATVPGQLPAQTPRAEGGMAPTDQPAEPNREVEPPSFGYANCYENAGFDSRAFTPDPNYGGLSYNPTLELNAYRGKFCVPAQAPWVEMGRGLYRQGPLPPAGTFLTGETNPIIPHFFVYGDYRTAVAFNDNAHGDEATIWANRLNLDFDLKITSTERIHAFWGPLDRGGRFTRAEFRDDNLELIPELDNNFDTLYFEGDVGYMWGGMTDRWAPFDLPFTAGRYPLLFQNGTWIVDAIDGFAFTFPGKNSPFLDWSSYDVTFFFAFSDVDSPAFTDDSQADLYGVHSFIDAYDGYLEMGYAYLNDRTGQGFSYHNIGISYTRRFFERVSTSFRTILNSGQDPVAGEQSADGQVFFWENAFVTRAPNFFVPYVNAFVGFDRPQSVARAAGTGGLLVNTGINFESDGLTNYPTLDATANNTWGGACGINLLGPDFSWQLITEIAMVQTFRQGGVRTATGDQYAMGARFQLPLNNAWLWRVDGIYGLREGDDDIRGARTELRWKF